MARRNAPPTAGDSRQSKRTEPARPDNPPQDPAQNKRWPFAEGSQNHLDEAAAPWPRPSSRPASVVPGKPEQPK
jgi:hypothetical protein